MNDSATLRSYGYWLLPLPPHEKFPPPAGWTEHREPYAIPTGSNVAIGVRGEVAILITNDIEATRWATDQFGAPNVRSVRGGHWYFRAREGQVNEANKRTPIGTIELHVRNKYGVIPPSIHPNGSPYRWERPLPPVAELLEAPDLRELWNPSGEHHAKLLARSTASAWAGKSADSIFAELEAYRDGHFPDPLVHPEKELRDLAESAFKKVGSAKASGSRRGYVAPKPEGSRPLFPGGPMHPDLWIVDEKSQMRPDRAAFERMLFGECRFLAFRDSRELRAYDPTLGYYVAEADTYVAEWVRDRFEEEGRTASTPFIGEIVATARDRSFRARESVNPPWFRVLRNGVLDLRSGQLTSFSPEPPFTFGLPVTWDSSAEAPEFEKFIEQALPDPVVRKAALEAAGYCLWPTSQLRKAFFLFGPTTTGKSTFGDVVRGILGPENTASVELGELVDNRFKAAELNFKLANILSDLPAKIIKNAGLFQELTGGRDVITAERKRQHPFQFRPTAKLVFSANRLPRIPGVTPAFWVRWLLLPFEVQIPKDEEVGDYAARLLNERDGIFQIVFKASQQLLNRGRFEELPIDIQDRWLKNSDPALWVCQRQVEKSDAGRLPLDELANRVQELCEEEGIEQPPDAREIGVALRRAYPTARTERITVNGRRQTTYLGVRFKGPRIDLQVDSRDGATQRSLEGQQSPGDSAATSATPSPGPPNAEGYAAANFSDEKTPASATGYPLSKPGDLPGYFREYSRSPVAAAPILPSRNGSAAQGVALLERVP